MSGRKKRVLFDLTPLDTPSRPRGIGRYIRELALGLSALPEDELDGIELLGLTRLGWNGDHSITHDIGSFEGSADLPRPTEKDFYEWAYRTRVALFRAVRRTGVDAVHLCDPHATPLFFGLSGARKITTCLDLVGSRFPDRYFGAKDGGPLVGRWIERRRYASADLVIAISDATRDDARTLLGIPDERIVRVYAAVDVARWTREPTLAAEEVLGRHGLASRKFLLYVGGCDWRKNVEGMTRGLAHARARGEDLVLAFAGSLGPSHEASVDAESARAGVTGSVSKLGYVSDDDLAVLYRHAVAHVMVSRLEGFGLTVVEAMASGCPVVTTAKGSLPEVAGDAALTVDPEDPAAIGDAYLLLARDPVLRAELAAKGRARAPTFSREAQARAMARVYRGFL